MFVLVPFFEVNKMVPACSCVAMMREQFFMFFIKQTHGNSKKLCNFAPENKKTDE
jgi:hypothetical protein